MKYTKTVPYFKKGDKVKKRVEVGNTGKTKEEIMAEARSNQTREKGQQAMDKEAKLAAENRKKASASSDNISKPKKDLSRTAPKKPLAETFGRGLTPINSNKKDTPTQKSKVGEMSAPVVGRTATPVERQVATPIVNSVLTTSARNPEIENLSDNSIVGWTRDGNTVDAAVGLPEVVITSPSSTKSRFSGSRVNTMSTGENTERETAETVPPSVINSVVPKKPFYIPIASEFVEGATNAIYPYARDTGYIGKKFVEGARSAFQPLERDLNWIGGGIKGVLETPTPNKQQNLGIGYGYGRSYRKQGGTINKFQRGNSFKNTDYSSAGERRKRIEAYRAWKNSDVATQRLNTLFDNTKRPLSVSTSNTNTGELAKIRPHWIDRFAGNSNTIVRKVSPNLQDTTYAVDDGVKRYANYQDGSYAETVPIIGPGRYTGSTPPTREALQNQFERYYKKEGGTIDKFQRGTQSSGITRANLPTTSKWNIFGFQPNSAKWFPTDRDLPKGQTEEVSRYMHRNKDITTLRRPRPYYTADQPSMYNSTRTINWDNNTPVDTTYTYGNKVIQPNTIDHERYKAAFAGGDRALLQNIGKRQQGGEIQQQGVDKEALVADFVVRYLKTMGVPEEAIVTPEGSVNPEYEKELTAVITEIDSPEFWEAYQSSPDEVVTQVVRERNPNAVTMARKGTKLKRLSQLRIYKK